MNIARSINKSLNIFTMYKGISFGLLGIWAVALVLSFFGLVAYSPLAMIVSLPVAILSVLGASYLCGRMFGVRIHAESSLITGVILALIISPTLEVGGLIVLAFAGLLAGLSKFILVHNGRHIFNPAAVGAFIVGIVGIGGASWWVATPVLTPIVVIVIAISLYKSHRISVALVFLAISVIISLIVFSQYGTGFLDNIYLLLSFPLLFMAGVMLTEPLTLPPRKWQMYVEAAIVAVLFSVPFVIDTIGFKMTPALALLIGNIVSALFVYRSSIRLVLKRRIQITPTTDEYVFTPSKPINFAAGQYLEVQLPHKKINFRGYRRSFSVTSAPNTNEVSFGIKFYTPSSSFKSALRELPIGSAIAATGYWGDFVLPKNLATPILYIAGGIGITPFISHLQVMQKLSTVRDVTLLYVVSSADEIAYKDILIRSGIKVFIVSKQKLKDLPNGWRQVKNTRIDSKSILETIPDVGQRVAYVSGPPTFVMTVKKSLRVLRVKHIKTDYFSGY